MAVRLILISAAICLALAGCNTRTAGHPQKRIARSGYPAHAAARPTLPVALRGGADSYVRPVTSAPASGPVPYTLGSGDRLRVTVFGQENLSRTYPVDAGGFISLPLIGAVEARGVSTFELEGRIASALKQKYVKDPKVTVEVETHRPFFILGEVRNGGQYPYVAGMTVQTAVAIAGGFTARAKKRSVQLTRQVNGATVNQTVPATWKIRPGDTITVKERFF
jgi:polysaccharide export outer membrane protein